jgi:hypothetical protein
MTARYGGRSALVAGGAIGALAGFTAFLVLAHAGSLLNLAFTPLAFAVALALFRLRPSLYVEFVLGVWMLAPLVRRLADWRSDFHALSPIMVAPLAVTAISAISAWNALAYFDSRRFAPYFAIIAILVWGCLVGVLQNGPLPASYDFLNWVCPALFAIHLLSSPQSVGTNADAVFRALTYGVLVTGVYGVLQYFALPDWDQQWMAATAAEMTSIGEAVAMRVRVFSTMNSPGPFGEFLAAGLLALFAARGRVRWLAPAPGLAALTLSLLRTAWGGFVVGLMVLFACAPMRRRARMIIGGVAFIALATPLLVEGPIAETFQSRIATMANLQADDSYLARQDFYNSFFATAASSIVGVGLGKAGLASRLSSDDATLGEYGVFDSGVMNLMFAFGLAAPLLGGLIIFLFFRGAIAGRRTPQGIACIAIAAATLTEMISNNTLAGVTGMLLLPMIALAEAQAS